MLIIYSNTPAANDTRFVNDTLTSRSADSYMEFVTIVAKKSFSAVVEG